MAAVVCENCGTSNPAGRQFCENCDGFLDWTGTEADPVAAAPPKAAPPAAAPQQQVRPQSAPAQAPQVTAPQYRPQSAPPPPPPPPPPGPAAAPPPHPGAVYAPVAASPYSTAPLQRICANCGTASEPTRRFCRRCGTWLVTPSVMTPGPPDGLGKRLRRRYWGGGPYSGDLTRGTIAFRVLSIFIVLAVLVLVMSLVGWHPIRRTTDQIGHILGTGRVSNVTAQAVPADAFPGLPAAWAVDDVRGRGFATRWTLGGNGDPKSACAAPPPPQAAASSLILTFPKMTNVREIGIEAGLPDGDAQIAARWRPQTLALYWPGGKCQAVQLAKEPGLQRFTVDAGLVNQVTIVLVAAYPPENGSSDRLDIGEITFWERTKLTDLD